MPATTPKGPLHCTPCNMDFPDKSRFEIHQRSTYHQVQRDALMRLKRPEIHLFNEEDIQ